MAVWSWAYVDCADEGVAGGPTGSVQYLTGANATSGSANFLFHTASIGELAANTMVLTGTLVVSGTISASHYHIENITTIDGTGSTYFGNTNDDDHIRTGSLYIGQSDGTCTFLVTGSNGRVGIGTSTPENALELLSSTAPQFRITHTDATDYATLSVDGDGQLDITTVDGGGAGGNICLLPDGYVGIGTTSPSKALHIYGASGEVEVRIQSDTSYSSIWQNASDLFIQNTVANGSIIFYDDSAETMRIDDGGKVGIGDNSPSHKLVVNGTTDLSGAVIHGRRTITTTATASITDYYIGVSSGGGAFELRLPDAATAGDGQTWVIKDEGGVANTNNVTVLASGSQTIDGTNSVVLSSDYGAFALYCNGADKYFIY